MNMEDDMFLPTAQDRLKVVVSDLRKRLNQAEENKERLRREIMEEEIAYIAASTFSQELKDTTRYKASDEKELQAQVVDRLLEAASARCIQELVGYYRLTGRTSFKFKGYDGIRFETFYKQTYHESYYVLSQVNDEGIRKIMKHTIPNFIPLEQIGQTFFPHDIDSFSRILHDFLLAYVARRGQLQELTQLSHDSAKLSDVSSYKTSVATIKFSVSTSASSQVNVELIYENRASDLPTKVNISEPSNKQSFDIEQQIFLENSALEAFKLAF